MTIDSLGRVVVSGPGYVRILVDVNGDGVAESYKQFADGPSTGAQGLFFLGRDLYCTGDAGLVRFRDRNKDDRADGPPEVLMRLKTGGEHYAHAVRKGPDGWWYIIVGNSGGISRGYATLFTSPIKNPRAGTLIRVKPDFSGGEIVADGMRNAYDFAFNPAGDVFTYESDNEREVSLPWYRPTRVLDLLPGTDAGWVSQNWIRPHHLFRRARGCRVVRSRLTDGRGLLPPHAVPGSLPGQPVRTRLELRPGDVRASYQSGGRLEGRIGPFPRFQGGIRICAATDVDVGPDGSLFVCVGGRGTHGAVYRVTYKGDFDQRREAGAHDQKPACRVPRCSAARD